MSPPDRNGPDQNGSYRNGSDRNGQTERSCFVLLKCFAPLSVGRVQTPTLQCSTACLTIFCALVLYDCACDMDHESVIKTVISMFHGTHT